MLVVIGFVVASALLGVVVGWTDPTQAPPNANVSPPVLLAQSAAQTESSANRSIWVNDTGGGNLLELQASSVAKFVVDSVGNLTTLNGATLTWPSSNAAGALTNNGSGTLSWGGGGGSGDTLFPEGRTGTIKAIRVTTSYAVPAGKNFWISRVRNSDSSAVSTLSVDGRALNVGISGGTGDTFQAAVAADSTITETGSGSGMNVFGIETNESVTPKAILVTSSYTVTAGKNFYITRMLNTDGAVSTTLSVDGQVFYSFVGGQAAFDFTIPVVADTTISETGTGSGVNVFGYEM